MKRARIDTLKQLFMDCLLSRRRDSWRDSETKRFFFQEEPFSTSTLKFSTQLCRADFTSLFQKFDELGRRLFERLLNDALKDSRRLT